MVLQQYLAEYFTTLCANWNRNELKLSIIDAFCGGGQFDFKGTLVHGSPLILLNAAREAEFHLEQSGRRKFFNLDVSYFFVDQDKHAINYLEQRLKDEGYGSKINDKIHLFKDNFLNKSDFIIEKVKQKCPRNGRSIFILDQYGYSDVPLGLIRKIFSDLPSSEIILTFAVDALLNFATDKGDQTKKVLATVDISAEEIQGILKSGTDGDKRLVLQASLLKQIVQNSGARYYTPFFIRGEGGHGSFWLVHLSQHSRARDVMTGVHWNNHNSFIHYGGAGMEMFGMLGYDQKYDFLDRFTKRPQSGLGFEFDAKAKEQSVLQLAEDIDRHINIDDNGISLSELYATTCNTTPATSGIYKEAIAKLTAEKQVEVITPKGAIRQGGNRNISDNDIIRPVKQGFFQF